MYLRAKYSESCRPPRFASSSPRASPLRLPPGEFTPVGFMYIIEGDGTLGGQMLREAQKHRSVWGDDDSRTPSLQLTFPALAATYLQVFAIDGSHMLGVTKSSRGDAPVINSIRWIMRRGLSRGGAHRLSTRRPVPWTVAPDLRARFALMEAGKHDDSRATIGPLSRTTAGGYGAALKSPSVETARGI